MTLSHVNRVFSLVGLLEAWPFTPSPGGAGLLAPLFFPLGGEARLLTHNAYNPFQRHALLETSEQALLRLIRLQLHHHRRLGSFGGNK